MWWARDESTFFKQGRVDTVCGISWRICLVESFTPFSENWFSVLTSDRIFAVTADKTAWVRVRATSLSCWFNLLLYCDRPSIPLVAKALSLRSLHQIVDPYSIEKFYIFINYVDRGGFEPMPSCFGDTSRSRGRPHQRRKHICWACIVNSCRLRRQAASITLQKVGAAASYSSQRTRNGVPSSQVAWDRFHSNQLSHTSAEIPRRGLGVEDSRCSTWYVDIHSITNHVRFWWTRLEMSGPM